MYSKMYTCFADVVIDHNKIDSIVSSGEEDLFSRGFSITMQNKHINVTLVDGSHYWKVSVEDGQYPVGKSIISF